MKLKKILAIIIMICISVVLYNLYHQKDTKKTSRDDVVVVKRIQKAKKSDMKRNVTKEATHTLERSDLKVSQKETEKVKKAISIPLDYLVKAKSQSDIKTTYDNKLSITSQTVAETIKTMLLAGYHFNIDSLKVYESDSDNVYQFTILLVTDKKDELSIAGNYVLGTQQFEFVSVHGTPVNVMF